MNFLALAASHRRESNSAKVAAFAADRLRESGHAVEVFDTGKTPLPLWSEDMANDDAVAGLRRAAGSAEALLCCVPEYSGMAAPAFKNMILMLSDDQLGHKPALLLGISAGAGGAYPIAELRMSSYKNTRLLWIPENVIVRRADDFPDTDHEETLARLDYALELLIAYAEALARARASEVISQKPYPFGV